MTKRLSEDSFNGQTKKVKLDDRLDPVEKLLLMNNYNNSILDDSLIDQSDEDDSEDDSQLPGSPLSINFNQLLYDNIRNYMSNKSIHNNSFHDLNNHGAAAPIKQTRAANAAPFFKNVNFINNTHYCLNDYFQYDDASDNSDDESMPSPLKKQMFQVPKISFHYRHNDTLSLNDEMSPSDSSIKGLKNGSILSGKASEMMGSGGFLINDFFL